MADSNREIEARYRANRRKRAKDYLGGRCTGCTTVERLEFDHIQADTKVIAISEAIAKHWSWARLVEELEKCQLLCKPCHIEKTRRAGETAGGHNKIINPIHGTWAMYQREGCRCDDCREWRRLYRNGYVDCGGCVLVAANPPELKRYPAPEHGYSGYKNRGCRCVICTKANREYQQQYRNSKKQHAAKI